MAARSTRTVLVTGASGLVGCALVPFLAGRGHAVRTLVRRAPRAPGEHRWDPESGAVDPAALPGVDAVVHLSGENVAEGRWSPARKRSILESRTTPTALIARALAALPSAPRVLVCASAVGIYGDRGEEPLDESSATGSGFLADVCRAWEAAAAPAEAAGVRVTRLRMGLVLSARGGALGRMLTPFRLGVGGVLGSGRQWMSWIAMDDLLAVVERAVVDESLAGVVNAVSPEPVTNRELTRALGRVLRRPAVLPVPRLALRAAFGEMAGAVLLASARVLPARLAAAGFPFQLPSLEPALRHAIEVDDAP